MQIRLPRALAYPVKVTELHVPRNGDVKDSDPLISYSYDVTFKEDNDDREEVEVTRQYPGTYKSPTEGKLTRWMVKVGAVIGSNEYVKKKKKIFIHVQFYWLGCCMTIKVV